MAVIVILGAIANPTFDNPGQRFYSNQGRAAQFVGTVTQAELEYFRASGVYSPTLEALVPQVTKGMPEAQQVEFKELVARQSDAGYAYTYSPGSPDESSRIQTYTLTARPNVPAITGCLSLFADESRVIRATNEDRAASAQDPLLGG